MLGIVICFGLVGAAMTFAILADPLNRQVWELGISICVDFVGSARDFAISAGTGGAGSFLVKIYEIMCLLTRLSLVTTILNIN